MHKGSAVTFMSWLKPRRLLRLYFKVLLLVFVVFIANNYLFVKYRPSVMGGLEKLYQQFVNSQTSGLTFENGTITRATNEHMDVYKLRRGAIFSTITGKTGIPLSENRTSIVKTFPWKPVKVREVHCSKLFAGDQMEIERAWAIQQNQSLPEISAEELLSLKNNCSDFKQKFGFITSPLTEEEERFPIAYSILAFKTPVQMLNLLKTIYRPQNYYCIHIDSKSLLEFTATITTITSCFENVFQSSRSADIVWGTITVLEAELICMEDLWKYKAWKYFINLTGQEFPLKTNLEIVRILTAFRGANDVDSTVKGAYTYRWNATGPPPHNLTLTMGSVHVVVNRYFVDFILHNPIAHDFFEWCRNTTIPDETFFATLNHNPHLGIPGSYTGEPEKHPIIKPLLSRYKVWDGDPVYNFTCSRKNYVRFVCIFSISDLPELQKRPELFANKFYQDYSRYAIDCMGEELYNRTRDQFLGKRDFNASQYGQLSIVTKMLNPSFFRSDQIRTLNLPER